MCLIHTKLPSSTVSHPPRHPCLLFPILIFLCRTVFVIVTKVLLAQLLPSDMHDQHAVDHLDAPLRREDGHGAHGGAV